MAWIKHKNLFRNWFVVAAACCVAAAGCQKHAALKTEPVEGLVTLDGEPVAGATVTFLPVQDGVGVSATGLTDETGKYRLTAIGAGPDAENGAGTVPGEYFVAVRKVVVPEVLTEAERLAAGGAAESGSGNSQRPKDAELTYVIPVKFNDPRNSEIKATVKQGPNNIPIELKSK